MIIISLCTFSNNIYLLIKIRPNNSNNNNTIIVLIIGKYSLKLYAASKHMKINFTMKNIREKVSKSKKITKF